MEKENANFNEFYAYLAGSFKGSNKAYKIEAKVYDSDGEETKVVFESSKGFFSHQDFRKGKLEVNVVGGEE